MHIVNHIHHIFQLLLIWIQWSGKNIMQNQVLLHPLLYIVCNYILFALICFRFLLCRSFRSIPSEDWGPTDWMYCGSSKMSPYILIKGSTSRKPLPNCRKQDMKILFSIFETRTYWLEKIDHIQYNKTFIIKVYSLKKDRWNIGSIHRGFVF